MLIAGGMPEGLPTTDGQTCLRRLGGKAGQLSATSSWPIVQAEMSQALVNEHTSEEACKRNRAQIGQRYARRLHDDFHAATMHIASQLYVMSKMPMVLTILCSPGVADSQSQHGARQLLTLKCIGAES